MTTLTTTTTAKLIGLAACGASAIGLTLDAALLTRTEDLLAALNAAGLLPQPEQGATPAMPPAAVLPTQERTRLIRPGMTIPAGDVDPEDESLYI